MHTFTPRNALNLNLFILFLLYIRIILKFVVYLWGYTFVKQYKQNGVSCVLWDSVC